MIRRRDAGKRFWSGADVRWVGRERIVAGHRLRAGDRATVVDPGRHRVRSFAMLGSGKTSSHGVVIRLSSSAAEVRVPARHLELVAPDHPLRVEPDAELADWWLDQLDPWGDTPPVSSFVPRSLPAVARVLHPWTDRSGRPVRWADVVARADSTELASLAEAVVAARFGAAPPRAAEEYALPVEGQLDASSVTGLVDVLSRHTDSADDVLFGVWTGWGDIPPSRFPHAGEIDTPSRGHFLLRGPLEGASVSLSLSPVAGAPVSGIWWPADRAWLVVTEIDFAWTFVAGSRDLVAELGSREDLEVVPTDHDAPANQLVG